MRQKNAKSPVKTMKIEIHIFGHEIHIIGKPDTFTEYFRVLALMVLDGEATRRKKYLRQWF